MKERLHHLTPIAPALLMLLLTSVIIISYIALNPLVIAAKTAPEIHKVGVLINGSLYDHSYCQAQYEGLQTACESLRLTLDAVDQVSVERAPETIERMLRDGANVIVADTSEYEPAMAAAAAAHPEAYFFLASGVTTGDNISSFAGRLYQARYLSGLVAGAATETGEIGYVLPFLTAETIRQLNAFAIGVRRVNPDATVYVTRTGGWNDADAATQVTQALLDRHAIDVLTIHSNTNAPLDVADARGIYTIGSSYDCRDEYPDTYLTACVYNWTVFYLQRLQECIDGHFVGRQYWDGIDSGLVDLSPLTSLATQACEHTAISQVLQSERAALTDGNYDVYFGPLTDIYGTLQVREGETVSDEQLLHNLYWFAEGLVIE